MAFVANPDVDWRILFFLPDKELLWVCSTSKAWYTLCTAPESEVYWQARYEQRFPFLPPEYPGSWRQIYWATVRSQHLPLAEAQSILKSNGIFDSHSCLAKYLVQLATQAFAYANKLPIGDLPPQLAAVHVSLPWLAPVDYAYVLRLDNPGAIFRWVRTIIDLVAKIVQVAEPITTPWAINRIIQANRTLSRIFPAVGSTLPILVRIGEQQGIHQLTGEQFFGMLLYAIYAANRGEVQFFLDGCPLSYAGDVADYFHSPHSPYPLTITMLDGDKYAGVSLEAMQGFITLARWLGHNYRLAYQRIVAK